MDKDNTCRSKNFLRWLWLIFMLPLLASGHEVEMEKKEEADVFGIALCTFFCMVLSLAYLMGRWSNEVRSLPHLTTADAEVQKDEPVIHSRLREELAKAKEEAALWRERAVEYRSSAFESRASIDLIMAEQHGTESLLNEASDLLRQALRQMDVHSNECPFYQQIWVTRHGYRWHTTRHCTSLEGRSTQNQQLIPACNLCSMRILPPDLVDQNLGASMRTLVLAWLDRFESRMLES